MQTENHNGAPNVQMEVRQKWYQSQWQQIANLVQSSNTLHQKNIFSYSFWIYEIEQMDKSEFISSDKMISNLLA